MVKLVGVIGTEDKKDNEGSEARPLCVARRQFPLVIEPELTMIMALDDGCLACGARAGANKHRDISDWNFFLRNYRSLSKDELVACLMVTSSAVSSTLSSLVTCVGCRRSVESLYTTLATSGDTALEPLTVSLDGVVSVNREHIKVETSLANLFCNQIVRLRKYLTEAGLDGGKGKGGRRPGRGGRCGLHSLETRKLVTMNNWIDTWECMEQECREEAVLIPFPAIRQTLDGYLKKHSFCTECTNMVNKAYTLLVEEGEEPAKAAGEKAEDSDPLVNSDGSTNLYCGISACTADLHVHVKCDVDFIAQLFRLAEPELSGLRQERHAKTIEIAQKEVLTCIGLALFDRFQRIQQKLREAEQTCNLLFLTLLKTLRMSMDLAAEKKRGIGDLELLCEELEKEEKKKEGKRERKKARRARKKEGKHAALAKMNLADDKVGSDGESNSGDSGVSSVDSSKEGAKEDRREQEPEPVSVRDRSNSPHACVKSQSIISSPLLYQPREPLKMPGLTLEEMLDEHIEEDFDEDDEIIPEEEIRSFLDKSGDMALKRQQLRENLKQRFAMLCVKAKE